MPTITTSDAVLVVSASRFGYPGVLAEFIAAADTSTRAADLAFALGEISAAVDSVTIALSGRLPVHTGAPGRPELAAMAEMVVCRATEQDQAGVDVVCAEATGRGQLTALLCALVRRVNDTLDSLDGLPGPGAAGLLERLGLAAAARLTA